MQFLPTVRNVVGVLLITAVLISLKSHGIADDGSFEVVAPVPSPNTAIVGRIKQGSAFCKIPEARSQYGVSGKGMVAAVIDTGIADDHPDFTGKVVEQYDFVDQDKVANDENGHGTHVSGIIAAKGIHVGVAPEAGIVSLKVIGANGRGGSSVPNRVAAALGWVLEHHDENGITVVNVSITDDTNRIASVDSQIRMLIQKLRDVRIPVVAAAGNHYYKYQVEGMSFPAICPETISAGAVFDKNNGPYHLEFEKVADAAYTTAAGRIAPFSQRLNGGADDLHKTDIFAPGATITSSGIDDRSLPMAQWNFSKDNSGTSMAAPFVTGTILLLQERFKATHDTLPTVEQLEICLRKNAVLHKDGSTEDDNVKHTQKYYPLLNALTAFEALDTF